MLQGISWQQFLLAAGGLLALYYLGLLVFYGGSGKSKNKSPSAKAPPENQSATKRVWHAEEHPDRPTVVSDHPTTEPETGPHENLPSEEISDADEEKAFNSLEMLASDIQQIISTADPAIHKADLLNAIQQEISRYPALNRLAFKVAISNLIIKQAALHCNIEVTRVEADALWEH